MLIQQNVITDLKEFYKVTDKFGKVRQTGKSLCIWSSYLPPAAHLLALHSVDSSDDKRETCDTVWNDAHQDECWLWLKALKELVQNTANAAVR